MDKFKFNLREDVKDFNISFNGFFDKDEAIAFVTTYKEQINKLDTTKYTLSFDCNGLSVIKGELVDMLTECIQMYVDDNFRQVKFVINKTQLILKMQMNRLIKKINNSERIAIIEN